MNSNRPLTIILFILGVSTTSHLPGQTLSYENSPVHHYQIVTDTLFSSPQRINILALGKDTIPAYQIKIAYHRSELIKTSELAGNQNALAAINGGFFDMDSGGSVSYFETNDSVIHKSKAPGLKWAVADSLINGAIILYKNHFLEIDSANLQAYYEDSKTEAFVLVCGPLLIKNSVLQDLPDMKFANNRHPRTCLGITEESIIFVTIDGRSETAAGMNLYEVQDFMLDLGCQDAINLDGGGSTSMWLKNEGIVNIPSDKSGERPVANALIILRNEEK